MSKYFIFATVSLALLLANIGTASVSVAFPIITSSFDTSLILAAWVINAYQFMLIATLPVAGKIGDAFGKKSAFIFFLSLFIISSMLCAIAPNIESLLFFRLIQGIGGGGFLPIAAGIVSEQFPQTRQRAIGLFSSIMPIGAIIGPNLGGWLITAFGWRSVFWLNAPLGLAALAVSAILLRSQRGTHERIDMKGVILLAGLLFTLLFGITQIGATETISSWLLTGLLFATSIILTIVFLRRESKAIDPIIDLKILREKPFAAANLYNFLYGFCTMAISSFIPFYAVSVYGMSTFISGLIMTPRSIGMILVSIVTSISLGRWGYRWPMIIGNLVGVLSLFLLGSEFQSGSILGIQLDNLTLLLIFNGLAGMASGFSAPAANNACIELMPERISTIVGIRGLFRHTGIAVGVAVISLVLHAAGNIALGFQIIFFSFAILLLINIPFIFAMPRGYQKPSANK